jgi:hypothetical protein
MRGRSLLPWLLRALSLAAMGLFFSVGFNVGSASAHQGHEHHPAAPAVAGTPSNGGASVTVVQASAAIAQTPCSDSQDCCRGGHCGCVMACHAALATLPAGPPAAPERPGLVLLDRSEPLAGLAGDRTERPPRPI